MTTDRYTRSGLPADELEVSLALDKWEAAQPTPPNIFDVIETGDVRLIGAYVLRGFRQAARTAAEGQQRVMELREFAYLAFETADAAEGFLRAPDQRLDGRSPLQAAVESNTGRDQAILQLAPRLRGAAVRVLDRLSQAWGLDDEDLSSLAGADKRDLLRWREDPDVVPNAALERISALLGIFRAINTLLPQPSSADSWIRRPNQAPLFRGRSALAIMLEGGLPAIRDVRSYLDAEIWAH